MDGMYRWQRIQRKIVEWDLRCSFFKLRPHCTTSRSLASAYFQECRQEGRWKIEKGFIFINCFGTSYKNVQNLLKILTSCNCELVFLLVYNAKGNIHALWIFISSAIYQNHTITWVEGELASGSNLMKVVLSLCWTFRCFIHFVGRKCYFPKCLWLE